MNKSQESAIKYFKEEIIEMRINSLNSHQGDPSRLCKVERFEVEPTEYGTFWVSAEVAAGEVGSMLHAVTSERWFVEVGKRGALNAHSFPKSLEDYKGRSWCGVNIKARF